jgi:hypothetical protein
VTKQSTVESKILIDQVNRFTSQVVVGITATALNSTILAAFLMGVVPRYKAITFTNRNATKIFGYTEKDFHEGLSAFQILEAEPGTLERAKLLVVLNGK